MTSSGTKGGDGSGRVSAMDDKGSRNKRKFRAEPPSCDLSIGVLSAPNQGLNYEFSAEKLEVTTPVHGGPCACNLCGLDGGQDPLDLQIGLSSPAAGASAVAPGHPAEEIDGDEFQDAGWCDETEVKLQGIVLSNLDAIFKCAIKKIVSYGYTEDVATRAALKSGVCYGSKDVVSNVVDTSLAFLRSSQEFMTSGDNGFGNLQELLEHMLAEMVRILKEVNPSFSTGDALWWLLLFDLNISHAYSVDSNSLGSTQSETSTVAEASSITKPQNSPVLHGQISEKIGTPLMSGSRDKPTSVAGTCQPPAVEEKFTASRKVHSGSSKRELLRQKSLHLEKGYRTYGSKGSSRTGKLGSFGGRILDKKMKSLSESTIVSLKTGTVRINKAAGIIMPPKTAKDNLSVQTGSLSSASFKLETSNTIPSFPKADVASVPSAMHSPPALPVLTTTPSLLADTELSLSLPTKRNSSVASSSCNANANFGQWIPRDKKDETILKLIPKVQELQSQLQEWTEWANQKVMQAAGRLGKDKAELKMLRQEKEEVERLKKDKHALEESTMKKLTEMESALYKASGQVDRANAAVRRLEIEKAVIQKEMEAAKLRAAESASGCKEALEREKKTLMECRAWERQKGILQDELTNERHKLEKSLQELEKAKVLKERLESRWKLEEKAKDELLLQASSIKREREQIEASTKIKEEIIRAKAEKNFQRCDNDIKRLEKEISQLRLKTDSSRIAALKQGINGSYVSKLLDDKTGKAQRGFQSPAVSATEFLEDSEIGGVKRERECVMCLSEEMSVVFLPCAHQVVCDACNELHEKQGMKECPSCRSPIQRRISVRYAGN